MSADSVFDRPTGLSFAVSHSGRSAELGGQSDLNLSVGGQAGSHDGGKSKT
jgi:hypothetical protein